MAWIIGISAIHLLKDKITRMHTTHECRLVFGKVMVSLDQYSNGPDPVSLSEKIILMGNLGLLYVSYRVNAEQEKDRVIHIEISIQEEKGRLYAFLLRWMIKWFLQLISRS